VVLPDGKRIDHDDAQLLRAIHPGNALPGSATRDATSAATMRAGVRPLMRLPAQLLSVVQGDRIEPQFGRRARPSAQIALREVGAGGAMGIAETGTGTITEASCHGFQRVNARPSMHDGRQRIPLRVAMAAARSDRRRDAICQTALRRQVAPALGRPSRGSISAERDGNCGL